VDIIDLREKNVLSNFKYMVILAIAEVIVCVLPNIAPFMKIILTVMFLFCIGALIWAAFFIKNELVFYKDKLIYNRYKERVEVNYNDITSIKYSHILSSETNVIVPVQVQRHYLIVTYRNSEERTMELFGRIFIEEEINILFKKYNLV
jgi:hypothetical protein